ncbi:MAG: galactokinase [Planctomycetes bacterium]|nr:galactokinase [Planctomycetota bacterium]
MSIFGPGVAPRCALAPGRVNLIGEHTDYNGGLVLPIAIDRHTAVVFRPNGLKSFRIFAAAVKKTGGNPNDAFGLTRAAIPKLGDPKKHWANYVRGVAVALLKRGVKLKGGDLYITADLPQGAGLSSSASLEVAVGLAMLALAGKTMDRQALAFAAQEAEHTYAGVRCGIMDQTVVARAKAGHALLLDCKSLAVRHVPIKLKGWAFAIFDTGVRHKLASSEYNKRRAECEHAAKIFGVKTLRDATVEHLLKLGGKLTASEHKRVRHVMTENLRTAQFAEFIKKGELRELGRELNYSHYSLSSDYQVSCPELDDLMASVQRLDVVSRHLALTCKGARMTGGGFGGAIVALVQIDRFPQISKGLAKLYMKHMKKELGLRLLLTPSAGARVLPLS